VTAYIYDATVLSVHDGDTCTMRLTALGVDVGFGVTTTASQDQVCRLLGMNARELAMPGGPEARDHLTALLGTGPLRVTSVKWDKYGGRADCLINLPDGTSVADLMIAAGFASAWDGRGKKPVPPWPPVTPDVPMP
jgi:endonuclease YncB( thermonuclease family)